jgi:hypothetical protein
MPEHSFMARWFLIGGGVLAVIGLVLWRTLPVAMEFPPYLATAVLALGYGAFCLGKGRSGGGGGKPRVPRKSAPKPPCFRPSCA